MCLIFVITSDFSRCLVDRSCLLNIPVEQFSAIAVGSLLQNNFTTLHHVSV